MQLRPSPEPPAAAAAPHGLRDRIGRPPPLLVVAILGLIVAGAIGLRFADLAANPGGLYPDEAAEGLDARRLLHEPGFHPVFFASDGGREALFAYVVAAVFRFAGETVLALRSTAAAFGVAAIPAIWLLARRFGGWVGLASAGWAAGSLWLVCISRDGMRNTIVPLFGALALLALLHWQARPGRAAAIAAGAATSLGALYTYQPLKLLPLLVAIWLIWLRQMNEPSYRRLRRDLVPLLAAFLVVGAPMLVVAVTDPASYFGRTAAVSVLNPGVQADSNLVVHSLRTLAMFAFTGDPNQRHDVDGLPLLGLPLSLVALAGVGRLWRHRREASHGLILWSLPVFLLPPLIATEGGSPHFLRALGLAAPLAVTVGLGLAEIVEWVRRRAGERQALATAGAAGIGLVALGAASGAAYLGRPVEARYAAYSYPLVALAESARCGPQCAVVVDDYAAMTVRFLDSGSADPPAVLEPGSPHSGAAYRRVAALSRADLAGVLGPAAADRATVVARDPAGRPAVWAVDR